jgi:hypothetical protein
MCAFERARIAYALSEQSVCGSEQQAQ